VIWPLLTVFIIAAAWPVLRPVDWMLGGRLWRVLVVGKTRARE
jgi:hypothetical protein